MLNYKMRIKWSVVGVAVHLLSGTLISCGGQDECSLVDPQPCADEHTRLECKRYDGNGITHSTLKWTANPCPDGEYCVAISSGSNRGQTRCTAVSPTRVPECAGPGRQQACYQGNAAQCEDGFVLGFDTCSLPCVDQDGCVACGEETFLPDQTCARGAASTCFENAVYSCQCKKRWKKTFDCSSTQYCVTGQPNAFDSYVLTSICAISETPDPGCVNNNRSYCSNGDYVTCGNGFATAIRKCGCSDSGACQ